MAAEVRFLNPPALVNPPGYSQVVEVSRPGRTIYIAGQLGVDVNGRLAGAPGDARAQIEQAFANLAAALEAVGAGFKDVVKLTNYLTDMAHLPILREVRERHLNAAAPPASTTVAITAFARPGAVFEVDAIVAV